jgi:general secretion pathway protein D
MRQRFLVKFGKINPIGTTARETQRRPQDAAGPELLPGSRMNPRTPAQAVSLASRGVFAIAVLAAVAGLALPAARLRAESANKDFKQGQAAEAREDYDSAFDLYQKALNKDPKDARFKIALARVRVTVSAEHLSKGRKLLQSGDTQGALAEFLHAAELDPSNEAAQQEIARIRQKQSGTPPEVGLPEPPGEQEQLASLGAPVELKPMTNEPLSLHMTQDAKVIYEAVGKAAGINVLFDPAYNSKRIQVDLNNVSWSDALRIIGVLSNTFWRPVTSNTIFVAENSRTKRQELDEQAVQTFYLTNAWQQNDLNDVQTALRNLLGSNVKVYGVPSQNAIVMRGTPDELLLAQQLVDDLDKARGEVVVDIAVLEVSKNWERTIGLQWPSSIGITLQPNCAATNSCSTSTSTSTTTGSTSTTTTSPTLYNLANLNSTNFAVNIGSATLNLLLTDSNTKILQSPRIRATDAQKATMKIGERIPIATGSYQTGAATALVSSLVNTQFQYQDVGVNIEMTPSIHYDHDVTLKINITVSAESGTETISGVTEPIISQRVVDQTIRLREGEASILGGIQNNQETQSWNGIPGLSAIPILKYIFGSKDHTIMDDDIVFVVVPHIVRTQQLDQSNLRIIDTGLGQSIDLRHVNEENTSAAPAAAQPASMNQPPVGTVPAQSAMVAAPQMLAQLRADAESNTGSAAGAQAFNPPPTQLPNPPPNQVTSPPVNQASGTPPMQPAVPAAQQQPAPALPSSATAAPALPAAANATFALNVPSAPVTSGASFQVPVVLNGGTDISSLAVQLHYDPTKLMLVSVAGGDLLTRDGQAAPPIHSDDGAGNLALGIARPPGTHGVTGSGVVCVLTFQAKAAGPSDLNITRASVVNSTQQQVAVQTAQANIVIK